MKFLNLVKPAMKTVIFSIGWHLLNSDFSLHTDLLLKSLMPYRLTVLLDSCSVYDLSSTNPICHSSLFCFHSCIIRMKRAFVSYKSDPHDRSPLNANDTFCLIFSSSPRPPLPNRLTLTRAKSRKRAHRAIVLWLKQRIDVSNSHNLKQVKRALYEFKIPV